MPLTLLQDGESEMTDSKHLISKLTADGKFLKLEDGFLRFWVDNVGAFSAHDLRAIADHLDRENKPWQKQLDEYFDGSNRK